MQQQLRALYLKRKELAQTGESDNVYGVNSIVLLLLLVQCGALLLPSVACAQLKITPAQPALSSHSIQLSWSQDFTGWPACSEAVTDSCITGFVEGYLGAGGKRKQLQAVDPSVCSGSSQPESCTSTFTAAVPVGEVQFYVATTWVNAGGKPGVTAEVDSNAQTVQ